ncbi:hypothetical protein FOCC_FOCC004183 [Frankliniella occidentalis]|nr:hypothetical protein FOCC_FOCC004183 [Frankliniella occidentalis]
MIAASPQQMGAEVLPGKQVKQVTVDRLRRRFEGYRKHQTDCIPRFNQSFNGLAEQNIQETLVLRQRYLESKAKRAAKKTDKKQTDPQALGPGPPPGPQQPHGNTGILPQCLTAFGSLLETPTFLLSLGV